MTLLLVLPQNPALLLIVVSLPLNSEMEERDEEERERVRESERCNQENAKDCADDN